MSKPKRKVDDSILRTQTRLGDSDERLNVGQSTLVQVDQGSNIWQGAGTMKEIELDQRIC